VYIFFWERMAADNWFGPLRVEADYSCVSGPPVQGGCRYLRLVTKKSFREIHPIGCITKRKFSHKRAFRFPCSGPDYFEARLEAVGMLET
jgi:hypothetical protein